MKYLLVTICAAIALVAFKRLPADDVTFFVKAAQGNIAEVAAAKLALQKSTSESVKAFAQMMIDDHTSALAELDTMAKQKSITLPAEADEAHKALAAKLAGLSGSSFDKAYMQAQVKDHEATIALFRQEASQGIYADTKAFAAKLMPKLTIHLQHATLLVKQLG